MKFWADFEEKFQAVSQLERIILTVTVFVACYMVVDLFVISPGAASLAIAEKRAEALNKKVKNTKSELTLYQDLVSKDPDANLEREKERIEKDITAIDERLEALTLRLVPGDELPTILASVLKAKGNMSLSRLQTMEVSKVSISDEKKGPAPDQTNIEYLNELVENQGQGDNGVYLYRHGVNLTVTGNYFDLLVYLANLQQLNQKFYWESLDYTVDQYPNAAVEIEVYTLSMEKGVLGG